MSVYPYNKCLITEVTLESLFLSTKGLNIQEGDWKSVREVEVRELAWRRWS